MTARPSLFITRPGGSHPALGYAAEELARCLRAMTGREVTVAEGPAGPAEAIALGLCADFPGVRVPAVTDPAMDDAIHIDVADGRGIIAGVNPRSVLIAVYRYLTELGCRWVRPGADGELIPRRADLPPVRLAEAPSYRHRAVCIEGATSVEHTCDMIEWLPRIGMNGYFTQFRESHHFFDRWYGEEGRGEKGSSLSQAQAQTYHAAAVAELKRRGLLFHAVGHGWTCEPLGIHAMGWKKQSAEPPADKRQFLALIDGERKLWGGVALNTNLCYSDPRVRDMMTREIVDYAAAHPEIDLLHFWLADGSNNNCECPECRKARPADYYVMMLNELGREMKRRGLATRVVFLIYVDLLWPPARERIEDPERFVLMFAPITRSYSRPFVVDGELPALSPYVCNKLEFPKNVAQNVAYLRAWQEQFQGDSFDFDYHLMWDHYNDPGHIEIAKVLGQDARALQDIGLNGYVSCQTQRVFLPTGLPMVVLARTLWDREADYGKSEADYFQSAFGEDGEACRQYLARLSEQFDPVYLRDEKETVSAEAAAKLGEVPRVVDEFGPVIERNIARYADGDPCRWRSWFNLRPHGRICTLLAAAYQARAEGKKEEAAHRWTQTAEYVRASEPELHPVLDAWLFNSLLSRRFE